VVNFLAAVGLVFIMLALVKGRSQAARERQELDEYKKVRDELVETKKEVGSLLDQLEAVSERVVEEITATVDEARRSGKGAVPADVVLQDIVTPENKDILSGDYLGEYEDEIEIDPNEMDEGTPEVIVELTGKPTAIKTYHREKTQVKSGINTKPSLTGKTFLFPRKIEGCVETPSAANHAESGPEVPPKHQMVYAMAKLGYSEADIAKQLTVGRGEVRLILQLKRKGEEANG
jgi:hypothetical protein